MAELTLHPGNHKGLDSSQSYVQVTKCCLRLHLFSTLGTSQGNHRAYQHPCIHKGTLKADIGLPCIPVTVLTPNPCPMSTSTITITFIQPF